MPQYLFEVRGSNKYSNEFANDKRVLYLNDAKMARAHANNIVKDEEPASVTVYEINDDRLFKLSKKTEWVES
jgi:hypothetical protein